MPKSKIPEKWMTFSKYGRVIEGTRLLATKVPLSENFFRSESMQDRFTPTIMMDSLPNLGLVIDLTYTTKYYNSSVFQERGVNHEKIFIPGQEVPHSDFLKSYLVLRLNYSLQDAIKLFEDARGHKIERPHIIGTIKFLKREDFDPEELQKVKDSLKEVGRRQQR